MKALEARVERMVVKAATQAPKEAEAAAKVATKMGVRGVQNSYAYLGTVLALLGTEPVSIGGGQGGDPTNKSGEGWGECGLG